LGKYFLGHISTFCKLLSQTRTKGAKKSEKIFYKCVLEFNFAFIQGSGLLIFFNKIKIVVIYTATSHEMANRSRFLIGIKKGDERYAEIHDGQALDLGEVGRRENAPARRKIFVDTSVADPDPVSGIGCFLTPGSGIRDPE
jgi:hypothetical protein